MKRVAIGMVALTLVLTACQSAAENIAENLVEQIAEQGEGVGDVDINLESGEINIETDEGAITIGGGDMPDDFPIPAPNGYQVTSVFTNDDSAAVSLAYPGGNYDEIVSFYDEWTSQQPSEWSKSTSSISGDEGTLDSANWFDDEGSGFISISNLCLVLDDSVDLDDCVAVNLNATG